MSTEATTTDNQFRNPFDVLAYVFMIFRLSLETGRNSESPPRYARIARCQTSSSFPKESVKSILVGTSAAPGLIPGLSHMVQLTLQAKEMLRSVDSLTALMEVNIKIVKEITNSSFVQSLQQAIQLMTGGQNNSPVTNFLPSNIVSLLEQLINYIPQAEDLDRLSHELYRLSCVIFENEKIDIDKTGKLRFLQWGFDGSWQITHLDKNNAFVQCQSTLLGKKNGPNGNPGGYVSAIYGGQEYPVYAFPSNATDQNKLKTDQDIETGVLLSNLNYPDSIGSLSGRVKRFQWVNRLPYTGVLDIETLNLLHNLDSGGKNLKRALCNDTQPDPINSFQTYGTLDIVNGDADHYSAEGIEPEMKNGSSYQYYKIGYSTQRKWIAEGPPCIPAFVAVQSRKFNVSRKDNDPIYEGGLYSEGEAADGKFFFVAGLTHPWVPGNTDQSQTALYTIADRTKTVISRIYQEVPIKMEILNRLDAGTLQLVIHATCQRRSLYTQRAKAPGNEFIPDQGRILLEIKGATTAGLPTSVLIEDPHFGIDHSKKEKGWMPNTAISDAMMTGKNVNQKNNWFLQSSNKLVLTAANYKSLKETQLIKPETMVACVYLEGKLTAGDDIDAYFDDVKINWSLE